MAEPSQNPEQITLEAELVDEEAEQEIAKAVRGRHAIARKYVRWVRRRNPGATPAEIIKAIERHYVTAISLAGGMVTAGGIVVAVMPGVGKAGVKAAAMGLARTAAAASVLPAVDEQLKFEITAMFGLALADIHGLTYDQEQAKALVYGLSNSRMSQAQVTSFAADLAQASPSTAVDVGQRIAEGRGDWSHWASTLATSLPGDGAKSLVESIQAGKLEDLRKRLGKRGQTAAEVGAGAVVSGASRFVFGREVVQRAQSAFPTAPEAFPGHRTIEENEKPDKGDELNGALLALQKAAQATGGWVGGAATAVGTGVAAAASTVIEGAKHLGTGLAGLVRPKKPGLDDAAHDDTAHDDAAHDE